MAIMLITHDLGVIAEMADDVVVMYLGRVGRAGAGRRDLPRAEAPLHQGAAALDPEHAARTARAAGDDRGLRAASVQPARRDARSIRAAAIHAGHLRRQAPALRAASATGHTGALLPVPHDGAGRVNAAGVPLLEVRTCRSTSRSARASSADRSATSAPSTTSSFHIDKGETLALVGESGCGKTTTSRCILRAIEPTAGQIAFRVRRREWSISRRCRERAAPLRREMQMIFQDPFSSLNPRMTLLDIVGEPLLIYGMRIAARARGARRGAAAARRAAAASTCAATRTPSAAASASASASPARWRSTRAWSSPTSRCRRSTSRCRRRC